MHTIQTAHEKNLLFTYAKIKSQISCLCFCYKDGTIPLLPKFEISSLYLLWLYSPVCVGPGRKLRRRVLSWDSYYLDYELQKCWSHYVSAQADLCLCCLHMSHDIRKPDFCISKTKTQISFAVTVKLIRAFVFATRIVQSLYFLNPKFQASNHLLYECSPVCVRPGWEPQRPVFSQRGSCEMRHQEHTQLRWEYQFLFFLKTCFLVTWHDM